MGVAVRELTSADDIAVTRFLDELASVSPSVLAYHYPFYRDMLVEIGAGEPFYVGAFEGEALVGLMPGMYKSHPAGTVFNSLPFFGPNAGPMGNDPMAQAAMLRHWVGEAKDRGALSCAIYTPFLCDDFSVYDATLPNPMVVEKLTQYQSLRDTRLDPGRAWDIRKARKFGIAVSREVTTQRLDDFYAIYLQNCRDAGIPIKPRRCLDFLAGCTASGKAAIYFAILEGRMISALLVLRSPSTASYYMPANLAEFRSFQAGVLLIDEAMQDARAAGLRIWNWEGSPARDSGVYRFKKKWGGVEGSYRIYVCRFRSASEFVAMGADRIRNSFPYYYVIPFSLLDHRDVAEDTATREG